jgi:diaminopimelate epimerase
MNFIKMHGLGNDFMVIDGVNQKIRLSQQDIIDLAQRNTGVGFDQCLLVETGTTPDIDFFYRIFNADGQEVGQCGNGARCLARFIHFAGLSSKKELRVATKTTEMLLRLNDDKTVTVNMGRPVFEGSPLKLPLSEGKFTPVYTLNLGNPHAVTLVPDITRAAVADLGKIIAEHPHFPEQTNAGFMQIVNKRQLKLRVYERGCGETMACGSGAVAAAAVGRRFFAMEEKIAVDLPGGQLIIEWASNADPIFLTGPATFVYAGQLLSL